MIRGGNRCAHGFYVDLDGDAIVPCPPECPVAGSIVVSLTNRYATALSAARARARELGYALAVHGSERRDLDLIAAPWTDEAVSAGELAHEIAIAVGGFIPTDETGSADRNPTSKPHGRLAWSIHLGGGPYIDLSVMPRAASAAL